ATDRGQAGFPEANPRSTWVEVGCGGLAVACREGELRFFPLPKPDERRGDRVLSLEDRFKPVGPLPRDLGRHRLEELRPGHNRELSVVPLAVLDQDAVALDHREVWRSLGQVFAAGKLSVGIERVDFDLTRAGRGVQSEELIDALELADRSRAS